jgi:hypothetical protein
MDSIPIFAKRMTKSMTKRMTKRRHPAKGEPFQEVIYAIYTIHLSSAGKASAGKVTLPCAFHKLRNAQRCNNVI